MKTRRIIWADDEIELLKPHIIFLQEHGYDVTAVTNGNDAVQLVRKHRFDVVLLDEMMTGMDGLTALLEIKAHDPLLPCVLITKSEEESLMEEAIGRKIDDYLTKPVNPSQILLACKKLIDAKSIEEQKLAQKYISQLQEYTTRLAQDPDWQDFTDIYVSITEIELELDKHPDLGLNQTLEDQKSEMNVAFAQYVEQKYPGWVQGEQAPRLSPNIVRDYVVPQLKESEKPVLFLVIDCLRFDQWLVLENQLREYFHIKRDTYYSILPTATPFSRNSIFAGMFPADIEQSYPDLWARGASDETSTNRYERQFLDRQLEINGVRLKPEHKYIKVMDSEESENVARKIKSLYNLPFVSMVWNFIDILGHTRSTSDILREIVPDEAAYRSVVGVWFRHSPLLKILKAWAESGGTVIITTDHGAIRGRKSAKVQTDRDATHGLRYKSGRNLRADRKQAIFVSDPSEYRLPRGGMNTNYILAREDYYFVYPTNYNKYAQMYHDGFQHGGVTMEEMILPVVTLESRKSGS